MIRLNKIAKDITHQKFGRLFVIEPVFANILGVYWKCKCDCGKIVTVLGVRLRDGNTKSCGCLLIEYAKSHDMKGKNNPNYKHGKTHNNKCKSCGKSISLIPKYCKKCYLKTLNDTGNPNYKNGKTNNNKCLICNTHISKGSNYCIKCAGKRTSKRQKGRNNPMFGKNANHGNGSYYNNIWFRSSWEVAYAKYLNKQDITWLYESKTFDLGKTTYTPDFYLPEIDTYIEIKGWWRGDAKEKFRKFKRIYNGIKIKLLQQKDLEKLRII
jgi:hypothetical protein